MKIWVNSQLNIHCRTFSCGLNSDLAFSRTRAPPPSNDKEIQILMLLVNYMYNCSEMLLFHKLMRSRRQIMSEAIHRHEDVL